MKLTDKGFYEWAVRKVARDSVIEDKMTFAKQFPPDEIKHVYKVIDEQVAPILAHEGIPIGRDELHALFLKWFVERTVPKPDGSYHREDSDGELTEPAEKRNK